MALSEDELRQEHKAKIFNAYVGNLAGLLVPLTVLALTLGVGEVQKRRDAKAREAELQLTDRRERESTRRECLGEMRETARLFATEPQGQSYAKMVTSVASALNEVCGPAGIALPQPILTTVQAATADPNVSPELRATAARIVASQPLRVFVHIGQERQRGWAREAELRMEQLVVAQAPVVVPGIELVDSVPKQTELRYVNGADAALAAELAQALRPILGKEVTPKQISARNVAPRTFELWISA